jgi:hypothetical protein
VEPRLDEDPAERLLQLFDELYGPECERQWIHYAVHLLTALSQCVGCLRQGGGGGLHTRLGAVSQGRGVHGA